MVYIKDEKKYYTLDECSDIIDTKIKKRTKKISTEIISKMNNNNNNNEKVYV